MRQLTKDPNAAAKARLAEQRAQEESGLRKIDPGSLKMPLPSSGVKKKPVFKSTLQPHNAAALGKSIGTTPAEGNVSMADELANDPSGAIRNGWYEDRYQPQFVTGCDDPRCGVCKDSGKGRMMDLGPCNRDVAMTGS